MLRTLLISLLFATPGAYAQTRPAAPPVSIRTPDPKIDQLFNAGPLDVGDDALASIAWTAAGRLDTARRALVELAAAPAETRSTADDVYWINAAFEFWTTTGDAQFLVEMWSGLTHAFRRVAARDADGDGLMDHPLTDIHVAAAWIAGLDALAPMATAMKDNATLAQVQSIARRAHASFEGSFWMDSVGWYAVTAARVPVLTVWPLRAMAFGVMDAERADRMLLDAASAKTVTTDTCGEVAHAHYRMHRGWSGIQLVRESTRGPAPQASRIFLPVMKGLVGWHADAPHRAAALEPHMPVAWPAIQVNGLRIGRDRIDATITREPGLYTVTLRRLTSGPPLSVRVAPALPLGADLERIVIDDTDAALNAEESPHDLHGVAELVLERDAQVEFHYEGGLEVVAAAAGFRVLDFRLDGRDYVIVVEGQAGAQYPLQLHARTRSTMHVTMPPGSGAVRKTVRVRVPGR